MEKSESFLLAFDSRDFMLLQRFQKKLCTSLADARTVFAFRLASDKVLQHDSRRSAPSLSPPESQSSAV
jgi:hypothetical protein